MKAAFTDVFLASLTLIAGSAAGAWLLLILAGVFAGIL
jgi:hypothetical protein